MHIDPILRALRSDPAPQRQAQAALEKVRDEWLEGDAVARVLQELTCYGEGTALADCPALDTLLALPSDACGWLGPLVDGMSMTMARHPLGHVPFRHQYQGGIAIIQLAERGRASLSLVTYEGAQLARNPKARSVAFADGERHECYLAGEATGRRFSLVEEYGGRAILDSATVQLSAGQSLSLCGPRETKLIDRVEGRLVMLRLGRTVEDPEPSREYRLYDGALLHRASGDRRESRDEMMMAVLGRMGRNDAAPLMAEISRRGSEHLRWQALRECLALDTQVGFAALGKIAADPQDMLSAHAGALRAQLIEAHPQLAALEDTECHV